MPDERPRLLYTTSILASFARNDIALLGRMFDVLPHVFVPRKKWMTPWYLLRQFAFLVRYGFGAKVLVCMFGGYHTFLPVVFGKLLRRPVLIIVGGFDAASFPSFGYGAHHRWPLGWFVRYSLRHAAHLVPVSGNLVSSTTDYLPNSTDPRQQGYRAFDPGNAVPYTIIAYGYDPERFRPMRRSEGISFVTVAQMNAPNFLRKGVDLMFLLAEHYPQHHFTLVGNTAAMRYAHVPSNLELVDFVAYERLPEVYAAHTFYLQLSIWEGFPSAPCEAMLCGCVPIVSRVAALPEIVGDAGFILDRKDIVALFALVEKALASDLAALSAQARQRIMERYPPTEREKLMALVGRVMD